jgi:hypothetical protein
VRGFYIGQTQKANSFAFVRNRTPERFFVLVATAQATVMWTPPQLQAYINKVVNHPKFGGRGLGRIFMDVLEDVAQPE